MKFDRVIGIDPGPIPGLVILSAWDNGEVRAEAIQCTQAIASGLLDMLLREHHERYLSTLVAVERFVVGRSSMRSAGAGSQTRDLVGQLQRVAHGPYADRVSYVERSASQVKPWATDDRLAGARLLEPTKGMRHARDAARHALFAAVKDGGLPDPMSKRSTHR